MDQSLFSAPHGLSQSITSFIASYCQGIHQTPFSRLIWSRNSQTISKFRSRRFESVSFRRIIRLCLSLIAQTQQDCFWLLKFNPNWTHVTACAVTHIPSYQRSLVTWWSVKIIWLQSSRSKNKFNRNLVSVFWLGKTVNLIRYRLIPLALEGFHRQHAPKGLGRAPKLRSSLAGYVANQFIPKNVPVNTQNLRLVYLYAL